MDLLEVDRALDMRIVYSLSGSLPVAEFTKKLSLELQSGLHFGKEDLELSFFIPEELASNREISIFLAQSNATKIGNVYFTNFGMATEDLHDALVNNIQGAKTVVLDNMYLSRGTYFLSCRFHSSELQAITHNVLNASRKLESLSVKYLGPNPGIYSILDEVKSITRLKEIKWQAVIPEDYRNNPPFSILPDKWMLESRFMTTGLEVSDLIKTDKEISNASENGFNEIGPGLNLYETKFDLHVPFLKEFFSLMYESKAVRYCRNFAYEGGILKGRAFIPEVLGDNYMSSVSTVADHFPDWEVSLVEVADFQ